MVRQNAMQHNKTRCFLAAIDHMKRFLLGIRAADLDNDASQSASFQPDYAN
jgi:hypothetical protein